MDKPAPAAAQLISGIFPFSELDVRAQAALAPLIERESYAAGTTIYQQNSPVRAVYFLLSGQVEVSLKQKKTTRRLAQLGPGDHFGEDATGGSGIAQSQAVCATRVILLKIPRANLVRVYECAPILKRVFALFHRTYQLLCRLDLPWRQPQETVYLLTRRTRFILWARVIPLVLVSLVVFSGLLYWSFVASFANVLWLVMSFLVLGIGLFFGLYSEGFDRLWQAFMLDRVQFPTFPAVVWFGMISAAGMLFTAAAGIPAGHWVQKGGKPVRILQVLAGVSAVLLIALLAFTTAGSLSLVVAIYILITILRFLIDPLTLGWINRGLDSQVRATVLSMRSQVDSLGQIAGGPLVGWVALRNGYRSGLRASALLLSPVLGLFILLFLGIRKNRLK